MTLRRRILPHLFLLALLAGCSIASAPPSMTVRSIESTEGEVRLRFSTDRMAQPEAQELLLLVSAIVTQEAGRARFQFRSVDAEGLADTYLREVRYFDVDARVAPLAPGDDGDPARKTYEAQSIIGIFRPKYAPILPDRLAQDAAGS